MMYRIALLCAVVATVGCAAKRLPPAPQLYGPGPGVDGPGPGVIGPMAPVPPMPMAPSQVAFLGPAGMLVQWDVGGIGAFDSEGLVTPGRYNFGQGAIYRLKLTEIPGRPGVELYPTLEVAPVLPRSAAYLSHNAIPVQFTPEDLDQVLTGNFVTKVLYLPDPEFQDLAIAGVETLVSNRLDPGVDPIVEADRRGAIIAIVRIGNMDLEVPVGLEPVGDFTGAMGGMGGPGMGGPGGMPGMGGPGCGPGCGPGGIGNPLAAAGAGQWGMTMSGTPIGLPGPPHIPLGIPAGLQKHTMRNHTHYHLPKPVDQMNFHVKEPGYHYPAPPNRVNVVEHAPLVGGVPCNQNCPPQ